MSVVTGQCYVYAEDLVGCVIGPFDTLQEAASHIVWCQDVRHDGAEMKVIESSELDAYLERAGQPLLSPQEDRHACQCYQTKEGCPQHGIAASNKRQNDYWQRVGGHD